MMASCSIQVGGIVQLIAREPVAIQLKRGGTEQICGAGLSEAAITGADGVLQWLPTVLGWKIGAALIIVLPTK